MRNLARLAASWPRLHLLAVALVTLSLGSGLLRLETQTDGKALYPSDNPTVSRNEADRLLFHDPEQVIVVVTATEQGPAVASAEGFLQIRRWHAELGALSAVRASGVKSVASLIATHRSPGVLSVARLLDEIPQARDEFMRLLADVRANPLTDGMLLSPDGRVAAIYVPKTASKSRMDLLDSVEAWISSRSDPRFRLRLLGPVVAEATLGRALLRDLGVLIPIMVAVMTGLLFLCLGTLGGVIVTMTEVGTVLLCTLGLMGHCGVPLTLVTSLLPVILMAIAVTDEIHLLERLRAHLDASERPAREAVARAVQASVGDVSRPIVSTSVTTSIGFLSFLAASIAPVQHFGVFAAFGICAAMVLTFTLVPALIAVLPPGTFVSRRSPGKSSLGPLQSAIARHPGWAFAAGIALLAGSVPGLAQLSIRDSWVDNFDSESDLVAAERVFNAAFWGSYRFDIVLTAGPEHFHQPEGARVVRETSAAALVSPGVEGVATFLSITDGIAETLAPGSARSSLSAPLLADSITLARMTDDPHGLLGFITPDGSGARVQLLLKGSDYIRDQALWASLEESLTELGQSSYHFSGDLPVGLAMVKAIVGNQLRSLALVLLGVGVYLSIAHRSVVAALRALAPAAAGTAIVFAAMGYANLPIGVATSMFACLTIGAGVDFALHFLHVYEEKDNSGLDRGRAISETLESAGRAIRWNFLVLAGGFSVLSISSLRPNASLGVLLALGMFCCYVTTLLLLPFLAGVSVRTARRRLTRGLPVLLLVCTVVGCTPEAPDGAPERSAEPLFSMPAPERDPALTAKSLMESIEQSLRRTPRIERMRIATSYQARTDGLPRQTDQELTVWGIFSGGQDVHRILYVFVEPASIRGTTLLLWDHAKGDVPDSLWIYLSSIGHFNKTESRGLKLLIPGTALSYDDSRRFLSADSYRFREDAESTLEPSVWNIVAMPQTRELQSDLGYSALAVRVDAASELPTQIDYQNANGELVKTYRVLDAELVADLWLPTRTETLHYLEGIVSRIEHRHWALEEAPPASLYDPTSDGVSFLARLSALLQAEGLPLAGH